MSQAIENDGPAGTLRDTADADPWGVYRQLQTDGSMWDDEMGLVIGSYELVRAALRQDEKALKRPNGVHALTDPFMLEIARSPRDITLIYGDDHSRYHRWWYQVLSRSTCERWRPTHIRPIVERVLRTLQDRPSADLAAQFADQIPIRVVASILGLPWDDDDWIEGCREFMDARGAYALARHQAEMVNHRGPEVDDLGRRAVELTEQMVRRLLPYAERAMSDPDRSDNMMCLYAKDGPDIFPDWGMDDMMAGILTTFSAGSHTTARAVCNGLHLLLTRPGLIDELREGGEPALVVFVEEALRIAGTTQFVSMDVIKDTMIGDVPITAPASVVPVVAAANVDPQHYECPYDVKLDRKSPRDHAAFWMGPRACGGMWLARAELLEIYSAVVEYYPDVCLDPNAAQPTSVGWMARSFRPLNVLLAPEIASTQGQLL